MKDKNKPIVVKDLSKLDQVVKELKTPSLPSVPSLSSLADVVGEKVKAVRQIEEYVAGAVKFICACNKRLAACKDHLERKIVADEIAKPKADIEERLKDILCQEDKVFKTAAVVAYLKTSLSGQPASYDEACQIVNDLISRGLLTQDGSGPILIGYQHFSISPSFGLDAEDIAEINRVAAKFSRTLQTLENQRRQEQTKSMKEESEIDLEGALSGKTGKCLMYVPAEYHIDGDKKKWRGGGYLLIDFTKDDVVPLKASGAIERLVAQMAAMKVKLPKHTLLWQRHPGMGKSYDRVVKAVQNSHAVNRQQAEEIVRKTQALWWLIHRGINRFKENSLREAIRKKMAAAATITAQQFFGLNGTDKPVERIAERIALLQFRGVFRHEKGSIFEPFFLVKQENEDRNFFEVLEIPEHLQEILGEYVGKQFPTSNEYRECPEQLRRLIRAIRGQVEMEMAVRAD